MDDRGGGLGSLHFSHLTSSAQNRPRFFLLPYKVLPVFLILFLISIARESGKTPRKKKHLFSQLFLDSFFFFDVLFIRFVERLSQLYRSWPGVRVRNPSRVGHLTLSPVVLTLIQFHSNRVTVVSDAHPD